MSLETMTKSHTYYSESQKPTSQPMIRVSPLESMSAPINTLDQKNPTENSTSSEASVAAFSEASSNCKYETSSEGNPRRIREDAPRPINSSLHGENDGLITTETSKFDDKNDETPGPVIKEDANIRSPSFIVTDIVERSESLPVMRKDLLSNMDDDMFQKNNRLDRISESSHARLEKLKKIVAYVESTGWSPSDVSLASEIALDDFKTIDRSNVMREHSGPMVQESYGFYNRTKGVTFLTMNKDIRVSDVSAGANEAHQHYHSVKSRKSLKPARTESAIGTIDDLIGIAENPNPSMKSIYFPPDPDNRSVTSELRDIHRESRNSRTFSRNRSDLDALSRIEDELIPLQNEFSKLVGKVRTLNLPEMSYRFRGPSSVMSCDTSGFFLHRAQVFCRNDSPQNSAITRDSQLATLSTADNPFSHGPFDTRDSCIWQNNVSVNNEIRFFHEKPVAYGINYNCPGQNDYLEKPMCFVHTSDNPHRNHLNRYHWSHWSSVLPTEGLSQFHSNLENSINNSHNDIQRQAASKKEFSGFADADDRNFYVIDDKIHVPFMSKNNVTVPRAHRSSGLRQEPSYSHQTSNDVVNINIESKKSQYHRSDRITHTETQRHSEDSKLLEKSFNRDDIKSGNEFGRSKNSMILADSKKPCVSKNSDSSNAEKLHQIGEPSFSINEIDAPRVQLFRTTNFVISQPDNKLVDASDKSECLDVQINNSATSYSGHLKLSGENVKMCKSEVSSFVDGQRIKFVDSYTERTVVRVEKNVKSEACDSADHEVVHENSENQYESKNLRNVEEFAKNSRDYRDDSRELTLPVSEEKITIVPVMYTSGIPESIPKFDLPLCRRKKTDKKRSSHRYRSTVEKVDKITDRHERLPSRNGSFLSRVGSQASTSFASQLSHFTDENSSIRGHEKPWLGQWRKDSRLLISYSRSNTAISVSSTTTINAERILGTEDPTSRTTISRRSKVSMAKRDHFPIGHNLSFIDTMGTNNSHNSRTRNHSSMSSARRRTNESSIGVRISPDDCLDDA